MLISVQTGDIVDDLGLEKGYALFRELGFDAIDWNLDHAWKIPEVLEKGIVDCIFTHPFDEIVAYYQEELDIIRKNGLVITQAHAPFPPYSPGHPEFLDYAIEAYKGCIRFCDYAGCKNLVIHGISCDPSNPELTEEAVRQMNLHLYTELIPVLKETSVTVCLENLFMRVKQFCYEGVCSDPDEAVEYIDLLNEMAGKECFGLCLDTGHLNLLHKNQTVYIHKLGKRIKALHIHDNDGSDDLHLMPFAGNVRWGDFVRNLSDISYDGDLSFETFNQFVKSRMEPDYIPVLLKAVHDTGAIFRQKIQK